MKIRIVASEKSLKIYKVIAKAAKIILGRVPGIKIEVE